MSVPDNAGSIPSRFASKLPSGSVASPRRLRVGPALSTSRALSCKRPLALPVKSSVAVMFGASSRAESCAVASAPQPSLGSVKPLALKFPLTVGSLAAPRRVNCPATAPTIPNFERLMPCTVNFRSLP